MTNVACSPFFININIPVKSSYTQPVLIVHLGECSTPLGNDDGIVSEQQTCSLYIASLGTTCLSFEFFIN